MEGTKGPLGQSAPKIPWQVAKEPQNHHLSEKEAAII